MIHPEPRVSKHPHRAGSAELHIFISNVLLVLAWAQVSVTAVDDTSLFLISARDPQCRDRNRTRERDQKLQRLVMLSVHYELLSALVLETSIRLRDFGWKIRCQHWPKSLL